MQNIQKYSISSLLHHHSPSPSPSLLPNLAMLLLLQDKLGHQRIHWTVNTVQLLHYFQEQPLTAAHFFRNEADKSSAWPPLSPLLIRVAAQLSLWACVYYSVYYCVLQSVFQCITVTLIRRLVPSWACPGQFVPIYTSCLQLLLFS